MKKLILLLSFLSFIYFADCSNLYAQRNIASGDKQALQNIKLLKLINRVRIKENNCSMATHPLILDKSLSDAAFAHAKDMAYNHIFKHDGSGTELDPAKKRVGIGSTFYERILYFGFKAPIGSKVGENLAKISYRESQNLEEHFKIALQKILQDKQQCKILMNPLFNYVGIGYAISDNSIYWVINYANLKKEK